MKRSRLALLTVLVTVSASGGVADNDATCTDLCKGTNISPKP
jgi:hypothetical protein